MIRPATVEDTPTICRLIRGLAKYERLSHEVVLDENDLRKHLFGPRPFAEVLLAEDETEVAGFALFFHHYSTFQGRPTLYLEDLFVWPQYRGKGHGKGLLKAVARLAVDRDCGIVHWSVLDWNELALQFYRSLGAVPIDEWTVFRLTGTALIAAAKDSPT